MCTGQSRCCVTCNPPDSQLLQTSRGPTGGQRDQPRLGRADFSLSDERSHGQDWQLGGQPGRHQQLLGLHPQPA